MKGNPIRGKAAFQKTCSVCHRLENFGTAIGADLASIRNRGDAAILLNNQDAPIGTRVFGPVTRELRNEKFMRIISLAPEVL